MTLRGEKKAYILPPLEEIQSYISRSFSHVFCLLLQAGLRIRIRIQGVEVALMKHLGS
jgi:hypothetical protein